MESLDLVAQWYIVLGLIIGSIDSLIRSLITNPLPKDPADHKEWFKTWGINTFSGMVVWPVVLWYWLKAFRKWLIKKDENS